jgi:hypothetical protein
MRDWASLVCFSERQGAHRVWNLCTIWNEACPISLAYVRPRRPECRKGGGRESNVARLAC